MVQLGPTVGVRGSPAFLGEQGPGDGSWGAERSVTQTHVGVWEWGKGCAPGLAFPLVPG